MAHIDIEVGGRRYSVACRDGEEPERKRRWQRGDGRDVVLVIAGLKLIFLP